MPMRLILDFERTDSTVFPALYGRAMEGMFFKMLSKGNASFSGLMHKDKDTRPFTLSGELSVGHRFHMHVSVLDEDVGREIHRTLGLLIGALFFLNKEPRYLRRNPQTKHNLSLKEDQQKVPLRLSGVVIEREETAAELFERAASSRLDSGFTLHFLTPTAFKRDKQYIPLPAVDVLLGGLARREAQWIWKELKDFRRFPTLFLAQKKNKTQWLDQELENLNIRIAECVLPVAFQLSSKALPVKSSSEEQNGCIGFCRYSVSHRQNDSVLEILRILLAMIPYTGIGARTAMGMGSVDVRIPRIRGVDGHLEGKEVHSLHEQG